MTDIFLIYPYFYTPDRNGHEIQILDDSTDETSAYLVALAVIYRPAGPWK
jgi:hypothetical protein